MKVITKERLLKASQAVESRRDKRCKKGRDLLTALATVGISAFLGNDTKASSRQVSLELNYQEIPFTKEAINRQIDDCHAIADFYNAWLEKIYDIQAHHGISGLEPTDVVLGHVKLNLLLPDEDKLRLISTDLDRLKLQKHETYHSWLDAGILRGCYFYQDFDGRWVEISIDSIASLVDPYDWADPFVFKSELHIRFLNGLDYSSRDVKSVSLCASRRLPEAW